MNFVPIQHVMSLLYGFAVRPRRPEDAHAHFTSCIQTQRYENIIPVLIPSRFMARAERNFGKRCGHAQNRKEQGTLKALGTTTSVPWPSQD